MLALKIFLKSIYASCHSLSIWLIRPPRWADGFGLAESLDEVEEGGEVVGLVVGYVKGAMTSVSWSLVGRLKRMWEEGWRCWMSCKGGEGQSWLREWGMVPRHTS